MKNTDKTLFELNKNTTNEKTQMFLLRIIFLTILFYTILFFLIKPTLVEYNEITYIVNSVSLVFSLFYFILYILFMFLFYILFITKNQKEEK